MRVSTLLPAALLFLTVPAFALKTIRPVHRSGHAKVQHASIKYGTHPVGHRALHAVASAPTHHEPFVIMPAERATAIQTALIQKGYLSGEPSGNWDAQTAAAMEKLQSDNGWQTRVTPDARALIKLGLGPHSTEATAPPQ
jgi:hypothetical protein